MAALMRPATLRTNARGEASRCTRCEAIAYARRIRSSGAPLWMNSLPARLIPPYLPRAISLRFHAIVGDLVLKGIHALPETIPGECHQLLRRNQPSERL